jgi:hypothetical protein
MFDSLTVVERRKHWWNGTWGKLARLDVYLYEDSGHWRVEAREGGADGRSKWYDFDDEDAAMETVHGLIAGSLHWREL